MANLLHQDLTGQIIGVYYNVYNQLSQTYPEFIYERAMMALLTRQGIQCSRQDEYEIWYKDRLVGLQRLDLFVAEQVVVELKVADRLKPVHQAQLLSYLKTIPKEVGLLLRFGGPKPEFVRRVLTTQAWRQTLSSDKKELPKREDLLHPELVWEIIGGALELFEVLGPGFVHRIYANALYHELKLRGLDVQPHRELRVFLNNIDLGGVKFAHLQIDNRALVFPVAVSDIDSIKIANLKAWLSHLNIPLGILLNFKTTRLQPIILRT